MDEPRFGQGRCHFLPAHFRHGHTDYCAPIGRHKTTVILDFVTSLRPLERPGFAADSRQFHCLPPSGIYRRFWRIYSDDPLKLFIRPDDLLVTQLTYPFSWGQSSIFRQ